MEGSGIVYPTVEIAGRKYTVRFSRVALYRLDRAGFDIRTLAGEIQRWLPRETTTGHREGYVRLSVLFDVLHSAVSDQLPTGTTAEQLVEMALPHDMPPEEVPKKTAEYATAIILALGKMRPPTQSVPLQEPAAITERTQ